MARLDSWVGNCGGPVSLSADVGLVLRSLFGPLVAQYALGVQGVWLPSDPVPPLLDLWLLGLRFWFVVSAGHRTRPFLDAR